ncbi:MAG: hypothetical protein O7D86_07750 [Proteobacteria bacterium]|nr:hypothetical protein [Pseudomonadota bacterium]
MEGEGEIHETDKFLRKQKLPDTDILPLYARLSSSRQNKIFAPHKRRHIVLATNIAETSLILNYMKMPMVQKRLHAGTLVNYHKARKLKQTGI